MREKQTEVKIEITGPEAETGSKPNKYLVILYLSTDCTLRSL